jgi:hypothetical protein
MRSATVADIVRRLTGTLYEMTAETALGGGMGDAQYHIEAALNEAIERGLVKVIDTRDTTYARNVRFVAVTDLGKVYCQTCIDGCDCEIGTPGCGHAYCWGVVSDEVFNSCPGALAMRA